MDLDIYPMRDMDHLFEEDYFFTRWADSKDVYNAILGTEAENEIYYHILHHSYESFYEKCDIEIYQKWKARFIFQTTGHCMLNRVFKKLKLPEDKKIPCVSVYNGVKQISVFAPGESGIFMDASSSIWYEGPQNSARS